MRRWLVCIGSVLLFIAACGMPTAPEAYDWRAEAEKWREEEELRRESNGEAVIREEAGVYSVLTLTNGTDKDTIVRCEVVDVGYVEGGKDLLLGRNLGPGQYLVRTFEDRLPRTIKCFWQEGTVTLHGVPRNGKLTLVAVGWQGTNVYVVEE